MGSGCSHSSCVVVGDVKEHRGTGLTGIALNYEAAEIQCEKCGQKFRATRSVGRITSLEYSGWHIHDPLTCNHSDFTVDESTKTVQLESTVFTGIAMIFTGGRIDDAKRSYWMAQATCNKCNATFNVRCYFKSELCNFGKDTKYTQTSDWEKCPKI